MTSMNFSRCLSCSVAIISFFVFCVYGSEYTNISAIRPYIESNNSRPFFIQNVDIEHILQNSRLSIDVLAFSLESSSMFTISSSSFSYFQSILNSGIFQCKKEFFSRRNQKGKWRKRPLSNHENYLGSRLICTEDKCHFFKLFSIKIPNFECIPLKAQILHSNDAKFYLNEYANGSIFPVFHSNTVEEAFYSFPEKNSSSAIAIMKNLDSKQFSSFHSIRFACYSLNDSPIGRLKLFNVILGKISIEKVIGTYFKFLSSGIFVSFLFDESVVDHFIQKDFSFKSQHFTLISLLTDRMSKVIPLATPKHFSMTIEGGTSFIVDYCNFKNLKFLINSHWKSMEKIVIFNVDHSLDPEIELGFGKCSRNQIQNLLEMTGSKLLDPDSQMNCTLKWNLEEGFKISSCKSQFLVNLIDHLVKNLNDRQLTDRIPHGLELQTFLRAAFLKAKSDKTSMAYLFKLVKSTTCSCNASHIQSFHCPIIDKNENGKIQIQSQTRIQKKKKKYRKKKMDKQKILIQKCENEKEGISLNPIDSSNLNISIPFSSCATILDSSSLSSFTTNAISDSTVSLKDENLNNLLSGMEISNSHSSPSPSLSSLPKEIEKPIKNLEKEKSSRKNESLFKIWSGWNYSKYELSIDWNYPTLREIRTDLNSILNSSLPSHSHSHSHSSLPSFISNNLEETFKFHLENGKKYHGYSIVIGMLRTESISSKKLLLKVADDEFFILWKLFSLLVFEFIFFILIFY